MATLTTTVPNAATSVELNRRRRMGFVFIGFALLTWLLFAVWQGPEAEAITTFRLAPGGPNSPIPPWEFNALNGINIVAGICAALGAFQLVRGFGRATSTVMWLIVILFAFAFLTWAASGKSLNLAGLLNATLVRAVPIVIGAMSGILSERAGIINIAIEGMMLGSAMIAVIVGSLTNVWGGIFAAILTGALLAYIHGVLSIKYKIDQIISGTVINIFAAGITSYISAKFLNTYAELNSPGIVKPFPLPLLSDLPVIGTILFKHTWFVYTMFIFLILMQIGVFHSRWGLRMRAVGEHPKAADTLGINVIRTRYISVVLSGMMAGFGGAWFTLGSVGRFDEMMTAGKGFIGLAAMIFGNYSPMGALGAGLLFGFADSLQTKLAILKVPIPSEFLLMAPYVITMIALAGLVGKAQLPAAGGKPYDKE